MVRRWLEFDLERPFAALTPGAAALLAGLELAELVNDQVGPAAAPAILLRIIVGGRKEPAATVTIADCIDGLSPEDRVRLSLPQVLSQVSDVCPVLGGLTHGTGTSPSATWHVEFKRVTTVDPSSPFDPADLALQVFRERQLLARLG